MARRRSEFTVEDREAAKQIAARLVENLMAFEVTIAESMPAEATWPATFFKTSEYRHEVRSAVGPTLRRAIVWND